MISALKENTRKRWVRNMTERINTLKYLSVKLPIVGAFLLGVLPVLIQEGMNQQLIPVEYHALLMSFVLPLLAYLGRKKHQPELHQIQSLAAVPNADDNLRNLFANFRKLAGGSLSQAQVDQIQSLIDSLNPSPDKKISDSGVDFIATFESLRLVAYLCPANIWTIGWGTTVYPNGIKVKKGDTCTVDQAKAYKSHDLNRFQKCVNDAVTVPINQNQFDALVSLIYNIGEAAFKSSTLLKKLNAADYNGAADQFLVWNKSKGKVLNGLVNRRAAERMLFLKP